MTSYNDYIASKRLYTINNISNSCNSQCIMSPGPLYDGGITTGCGSNNCEFFIGPTGPPGDKYVSYFNETFYNNTLVENGTVGIVIDKNLAYLPGMKIKCQTVNFYNTNDIKCFYGFIDNYDATNGVIIIKQINNISTNFPYGIKTQFVVNVDNTGPPLFIQGTVNQINTQLNPPETYVISLNDNVIINNSLTFTGADASNTLTYESFGTSSGFSINDNLKIDNLYFTASGNNNISYIGNQFKLSDNVDISGSINISENVFIVGNTNINGNIILGNIVDSSNSIVYAKLPQMATTLNSYSVRMAYTNISGIFKWQLFASTSTKSQKTNIQTLPDNISILNVRPVTYNPISPFDGKYETTHIGFIAEEMAENELGNYFVIRDEDGVPKSIQYDLMIPVYASAMRNLKTRVEELEEIVKNQENRLKNIEDMLLPS